MSKKNKSSESSLSPSRSNSQESVNESKLAESQLAAIVDISEDAIITIDSDLKICLFNRGAERIFGYTLAEVLGQSLDLLLPERYRTGHDERIREFGSAPTSAKLMGHRGEIVGLRRDGQEFPAEASIAKVSAGEKLFFSVTLRDVTKRKEFESQLKESLKEKDLLLQEVHHRVKNNLQVVSSLLSLQAEHLENRAAVEALLDCQSRVKSIGLIHERLYRSGQYSRIRLDEYVSELAVNLLKSFDGGSSLKLDVAPSDVTLPLDLAIPCGLVINELLTNCVKHAFPKRRNSRVENFIAISIDRIPGQMVKLAVVDNGVGLKPEFDFLNSGTLGLELVVNLVSQISGNIEFINKDPGLEVKVVFPLPEENLG